MRHRAPEPSKEPLLSPARAFVLQFHPQADVTKGVFVGRVEHVASGKTTRFTSLDELVAFLGRVLAETDTGNAGEEGSEGRL